MRRWLEKHSIVLTLIPVLLMMGLIFFFSAQNGESSGGLSRRITGWLLETCVADFGAMPPARQELLYSRVGLVIRKLAHFSEFAALGFFLMLHIRKIGQRTAVCCPRLWAWGVGTMYAVSDEVHQHFVGGRSPALTDVLIDSSGVIMGVLLLCWGLARRKKE